MDNEKGPKHVVLYVINYTYTYHHIVVLDRYTNPNLVYKFERLENFKYLGVIQYTQVSPNEIFTERCATKINSSLYTAFISTVVAVNKRTKIMT